jgi:hypothetical protein
MSSAKIEKIIARLQKRIAEGAFEEQYEAAQETRLVAARYAKQANWAAAIDILSRVSQALLRAGQGGSGGDLAVLLVDVYRQAAQRPDGGSRGRLLTCLRLFEPGEPMRKKFIKEMIEWVFFLSLLSVVYCYSGNVVCEGALRLTEVRTAQNTQLVEKVRRLPSRRPGAAPRHRLSLRRRAPG